MNNLLEKLQVIQFFIILFLIKNHDDTKISCNDNKDIEISKDNNNNMIISNMSDVSITAIDNYNNDNVTNISNIDSSSDMSRSNNKIDIMNLYKKCWKNLSRIFSILINKFINWILNFDLIVS